MSKMQVTDDIIHETKFICAVKSLPRFTANIYSIAWENGGLGCFCFQ